ncbi:cytochrome P450 [Biscogniauxia mediterranea]|nr:cytochrome P450 [Biscogniauxia mediterranea]
MQSVDVAYWLLSQLTLPVITYIIVVFSYRLLLHPLRFYSGPPAGTLSDAYSGYFSMQRHLHLVAQQEHHKCESVIRHGPSKLLFNLVKALLGDIYDNDHVVKSHVYHATVWEPVNITNRVGYLACDIITLLSLGFRLDLQTNSICRFMVKEMFLGNHGNRLPGKIIVTRSSEDKHIRHDLYSIDAKANSAFSTSAGICALFFSLPRNPKLYRRVGHEIRSTSNDSTEIWGGLKLSGCEYLRACIDEAFHIAPPASGLIPPGTQVGINMYTLHHNEEDFHDSFMLLRERKVMTETFIPFLMGYRGCAGNAMAYLKTGSVVADIMLGGNGGRGRPDEYKLYDVIAGQHDGPYLVLKPRSDSCKGLPVDGITS